MITVFWLALAGYLLVGLGDLIPAGFNTKKTGVRAMFSVCLAALVYALSWPWRYARGQALED